MVQHTGSDDGEETLPLARDAGSSKEGEPSAWQPGIHGAAELMQRHRARHAFPECMPHDAAH